MKGGAVCLTVLALMNASVLAQDVGDPMEKLRACSQLAQAERLDCLEKLSRDMAPPPSRATSPSATAAEPAASVWIVSETTSPIDYSPVAVATASSRASADGTSLQLSIQCRAGRTDLVIGGAALVRRVDEYAVSYVVNDGQPVMLPVGPPAAGTGVAVRSDVVRLLASLPDRGDVAFRLAARQGELLEGKYALADLRAVLQRLAGPCKWPAAAGVPRPR